MLLLPLDLTLKLRPPPYISRTFSLRLHMSHEAPWSSCKEIPAGYSPNMPGHTNTLRLNTSPPPFHFTAFTHSGVRKAQQGAVLCSGKSQQVRKPGRGLCLAVWPGATSSPSLALRVLITQRQGYRMRPAAPTARWAAESPGKLLSNAGAQTPSSGSFFMILSG